jgi:hypothetical protein
MHANTNQGSAGRLNDNPDTDTKELLESSSRYGTISVSSTTSKGVQHSNKGDVGSTSG